MMVLEDWDYTELFLPEFWRKVILYAQTPMTETKDEKSVVKARRRRVRIPEQDIKILWDIMPDNLQGLYFHSDYRLFKYWFEHLRKKEIEIAAGLIKTGNSIFELESFIIDSDTYGDMLDYAETLKHKDETSDASNSKSISFELYLKQVHKHAVLMFITQTQVMIGGHDKEKLNDAYMKLLQAGYIYIEKLLPPTYEEEKIPIYIFDAPLISTPNYLGLN